MTTLYTEVKDEFLDRIWHALFHMDTREIARHIPAEEVKASYEEACEEAEKLRAEIEHALAYSLKKPADQIYAEARGIIARRIEEAKKAL